MKDQLSKLESQIISYSKKSQLSSEELLLFPEYFRIIFDYQLFGNDLLAIPTQLMFKGEKDEFEKPFSFFHNMETLQIFESEYRPDIPTDFIQIGNLYGTTDLVLLNKQKETIHIIHVSDIVDTDWLKHKLEQQICDLKTFINSIRVQTVCCLMDPNNYSKFELIEIRNQTEIKTGNDTITCLDKETTWLEYRKLVDSSLAKGYELHYAPGRLIVELEKLER